MARQSLQKVYADFRKGWVDVASPLQQPEGTVKDIVNFDINIDGTLSKRAGLRATGANYYTTLSQADIDKAFSVHLWENVDNDKNKKFAVVRVESDLSVFDVSHGNLDMSSTYLVSTKTLPKYISTGFSRVSSVSALGRFFFASNDSGMHYLEYNSSTNTVAMNTIDPKVRDTELWEGPTDTDTGYERSTASLISPWHEYNLRNGGWPTVTRATNAIDTYRADTITNPISYTRLKMGFWPKLAESFYMGRSGGGDRVYQLTAYNPWQFEQDYFGNSVGAIGKKIINVSNFLRQGFVLNSSGTVTDAHTETYALSERLSRIAFYSGRLWYAGNGQYSSTVSGSYPKSPISADGLIYYSQTIDKNLDNVDKCYQENDPTAEDINQLLPTDGGSLSIKEVGNIKALVPLATSLFILSDQGIWRIAGKDLNSFNADGYIVDKISDKGVLSDDGYATSSDSIYIFGEDGIFVIQAKGGLGEIAYADISTPLIKNFFYTLPKKTAESAIIKFDKTKNLMTCFLAIPDEGATVTESFYKTGYNTVLVFNTDLGCFYKYRIDLPEGYKLLDALYGLDTETIYTQEAVFDSLGANYTDSLGAEYYIPGEASFRQTDSLLQVIVSDGVDVFSATFSDSTTFEDLGVGFEATTNIGFDSVGDLVADWKQAPYILAYLKRGSSELVAGVEGELDFAEKHSCKLGYHWDWETAPVGSQELYRLNRFYVPASAEDPYSYNKDVIQTKNRVRGRGTAMAISLTSPVGYAANVLGLGVRYTG